jgi:hypothetical protein
MRPQAAEPVEMRPEPVEMRPEPVEMRPEPVEGRILPAMRLSKRPGLALRQAQGVAGAYAGLL